MCGCWLDAAPGPTSSAQAEPEAHCTNITPGAVGAPWPVVPPARSCQLCPPSALSYSLPSAPSHPFSRPLKQTLCELAGAGTGCQLWPPLAVTTTVPPVLGAAVASDTGFTPPAMA